MFEIRTDAAQDGVIVVRAAGEVDMTVSPVFERCLLDAANTAGVDQVVVDLELLRFLDSSGLHALVKGYHAANGNGGSLVVRHATGTVARVLTITGVAEALGMAEGATRGADNRRPAGPAQVPAHDDGLGSGA